MRSHPSVSDLARLAAESVVNARPAPLPPAEDGPAMEVERLVSGDGLVSLGTHCLLAAEILGDHQVGIRIEHNTLMLFDPATRELLRAGPSPLTCAITKPIPNIKADRRGPLPPFSRANDKRRLARKRPALPGTRHRTTRG